MGRPPLGPAKKSRRIPLNVTDAQYAKIQAKGGTEWVRRTVLAALTPTRAAEPVQKPQTKPKTPAPEPPPSPTEPTTHRHKRVRVGDKWVKGTNVGEYACETCGVEMGVLQ